MIPNQRCSPFEETIKVAEHCTELRIPESDPETQM